MTKMFGNLTNEGLEEAGDRLGGSVLFPTNVYEGVVKMAYAGKAQSSNAQSVTVIIELDGKEFRETHWVTNKNGENSWQDKTDPKKKHPLPGFTSIDDLCLVTTGYGLADQDIEEKVVKIFDFEQKKDVPTNVPVLVNLLGKPVFVAVVQQTVDKQKKTDAGYVNTGETRNENIAEKFFHHETRRTVTEIKQGLDEAIFMDAWKEKNAGQPPRNKAKGADGKSGAPGAGGNAGAPSASAAQKPAKSLFGN